MSLVSVIKQEIENLPIKESLPLSIQLRFWDSSKKGDLGERLSKLKGITIIAKNDLALTFCYETDKIKIHGKIIRIKPFIKETLPHNVTPIILIIVGKYNEREHLSKRLSGIGLRRGWLKQKFLRDLDKIVGLNGWNFELLSLVYELRIYHERIFTAAGTANFWPKGVETVKEALEEYLLPIEKTRGYYIFIKSLRFKVSEDKKPLGIYTLDRWGRITLTSYSNLNVVLNILPKILEAIVSNYLEYTLRYSVSEEKVRGGYTAYYLERAESIYFSALNPGSEFFNTVKVILGKPGMWNNNVIILPIEVGNPRIVSRIIDRRNGMAVTLVATYNGIRVVPAPGSSSIDAEMIDTILSMFRNLVSE